MDEKRRHRRRLAILLDFDGTITERDVGDLVISKFARPGWRGADDAFRRGELLVREMWAFQIGHLTRAREAEAAQFAREVAKTRPGLHELISFCEAHKIPVEVASSGLRFYIDAILEAARLDGRLPVSSPVVDYDSNGNGVMTVEPGLRDCAYNAMCKCDRVWRMRRQGLEVLFAGDGVSDYCVSSQADHLMATAALARRCQRDAVPYTPFSDLFDVLDTARALLGQRS